MKGSREIRRRLKAVQSTAKITRAMQLVASSKMRRAQRMALDMRPYAHRFSEMLAALLDRGLELHHPFLQQRPVKNSAILLIATDKGLCGALNTNVIRLISQEKDETKFIAVGKKGASFLANKRAQLLAQFSINDQVPFHEVRALANFLRDTYLDGSFDRLEVVFPVFVNMLKQVPVRQQLLPLTNISDWVKSQGELLKNQDNRPPERREMIIEPSQEELISPLCESFLTQNLYHCLVEAKAAEQSARMVAMKTATDNAEALAKNLKLEFNKARQAAITNEILEITPSGRKNS